MNKHRCSIYALIILVVFTINIGCSHLIVYAASDNMKYKTFNLGSDINFKGVFSSHSLYFNVDDYSVVKSLEANVAFYISQLITEKQNATITLSVNGTPFYSARVFYKDTEEEQNIKVTIPIALIKTGLNEFKIETYSRISDKPCTDDVNNGNWITLKSSSNILMGFMYKESTNNISEFPYPFNKVNENNKYNTVIAIPDNYKEEQLTAALMLQSYLGEVNKGEDYNGLIVKYSSIPGDKNIIYIGGFNDLPDKIKSQYSGLGKQDYKEYAFIRKSDSPFNDNNKLISIVSENGNMLINAVKLLMNKDLATQINTDTFKLDNGVKVDNEIKEESSKLTFKDLGLDEMQLKGPFRQSGSISYSLPANRTLASGAKIRLFMRYSQNLDFDRSLLTIYINGIPIGSKKLDKDLSYGDQLELNIPKDVNMSSNIDIKIAFDLEQKNLTCEFRQEETPWALVTGDSYIYIPSNKIDFYKFDTYPEPFVSERQFNDIAFVVPENLSENEIEGISKIFSYMGRDICYNNGILKVINEKNFSDKYNNMNLIVYGTPENNKLIKTLNSRLWFRYNDNYKSFIGTEKLYLTEPYNSNISIFQFDESPYDKDKAALVLTSPNKDLLLKSLVFLSSTNQISKLSGDCALIDNFGNIKTFQFKKDKTNFVYNEFKNINTNGKMFVGFMGMFLAFSIVAVALYLYKNKKFK